jgi:hypothetical protein
MSNNTLKRHCAVGLQILRKLRQLRKIDIDRKLVGLLNTSKKTFRLKYYFCSDMQALKTVRCGQQHLDICYFRAVTARQDKFKLEKNTKITFAALDCLCYEVFLSANIKY